MSTPSWQQVFDVFEEAVELPGEEREAFLDQACATGEMRRMVDELLAVDREEETFADDLARFGRAAAGRDSQASPGTEPAAEADSPATLGAYRILRRIGQGGMSTVYLAVRADDAFRRQVVVKLVRQGMETEPFLRRLRTERQILASLDHPNIARLFDGGSTESGLPYFVMEYIEGESIDRYCTHEQLSVDQRLTLVRKVCAAVQYAHQNLVIHRDIKPSNILVTPAGEPKLLDFGIARLLNPSLLTEEVEPTATWQRIMTPSYASPEQLRGQPVGTASDVYSLGVLLYKLLTGRLPRSLAGLSPTQIDKLLAETEPQRPSDAYQQGTEEASRGRSLAASPRGAEALDTEDSLHGSPGGKAGTAANDGGGTGGPVADLPPGSDLARELVGDLDAIVLKALRTSPSQRYGSAEQLEADLERYQRGLPVTARAPSWRYRAGKFVRRNRGAVAAAAAAVLLLLGFTVAMAVQSARVARERDQARLERDKKQEVLELILDVFRFSNPYVLPGEELTVRDALARSVPVLEEGLHSQPEVRAELLHTSGSILGVLGEYGSAESQLAEALELRRALHGDSHGDVVATLSALAAVRKELGELKEAEALALRAVELARGLGEEPRALLASALNELAGVRCYLSEYEAAESPARDALALARRSPAAEQEIRALESLGQIESTRGNYAAAAAAYRESLTLRRQRYGDHHPSLVNALSNLGLVLRRQEDFAAAEAAYQELIDLQRESFGEEFKDPFTLANLAGLRFGQGDYESSMSLYQEALDAVHSSSGPDHWMIYVFELGMEDARLQSGQAEEAERRLRALLDLWRPRLGDDHWRIAQGESVLGESLSVQGRCEAARRWLDASYEVLSEAARERQKQDARDRLERHAERCGKV